MLPPAGQLMTAQRTAQRCLYYAGIVEQWLEQEEFEYLDSVPLVLAVMAHESACVDGQVSQDGYGSIGLMQVTPRAWTAPAEMLRIPRVNIYWGMWILDRSIAKANGDVRLGLAYYNCSAEAVHADRCGPRGGLNYADDVLSFWLPMFRAPTIPESPRPNVPQ